MKKLSTKSYSHFGKATFFVAILAFIVIAHFSYTGISLQTAEARTVDPTTIDNTQDTDNAPGISTPAQDQSSDTTTDQGSVSSAPTNDDTDSTTTVIKQSTDQSTDGTDATSTATSTTSTQSDQTSSTSDNSASLSSGTANDTTGTADMGPVQVTANGISGTLTITDDSPFEIDWVSQNVTNCSIAMDGTDISSVASFGSMGPIDSTHIYYPAVNASHTFTVHCEGLSGPVQGSVIVTRTHTTVTPAQIADPQVSASVGTQCGGTIDLSWGAVTGATSYIVLRDNSQIAQISGTTFSDSGLDAGSTHSYIVKATNGTLTSAGADQIATTASGVCGGDTGGSSSVDITASGSQGPLPLSDGQAFTVDWISQNATNCTVSSDNLFSSGVPSQGTLGTIDTTHAYYPAAGSSRTFNIHCEGLSGQVQDSVTVTRPDSTGTGTTTPVTIPAPVLHAATGTACGGAIDLTWNSITGATSYEVFRDGSQVAQISENTFTDTGLPVNEAHSYTVKALTATAESALSNTATASSSDVCNTGGGSNPQSSQVEITANGTRGTLTLTEGQPFTIDWTSQNATNCTVSSAQLFSSGVDSNGSLGTIDSAHPYYPPAGGSRTFTIVCTGLQGQISDSVTVIRPQVPQPPVAPNLSNIATTCDGTVTLTFNTVSDATSYKIFRNGTQIATVTAGSFVDSHLTPGAMYSYVVRATNANGDSPASNSVSTTIPNTCATAPTAPSIFASTGSLCGGTVFVSWNAVMSATSYNVFRNGALVATSSNVSFTDTGLTPGSSYSYTVQAVNAVGTSPASNGASATASAACVIAPTTPTLTAITSTDCGGTIVLNWNAVSSATSYRIFRNGMQIANSTSTSYTDSGLSVGTSYSYTISASNSAGTSPISNTATATSSNACGGGNPQTSTVDITANGSQGPVTLSQGQSFTVDWTSQNATNCTVSSDNFSSGVASMGSLGTISPNSANYPAPGTTKTFTIVCMGLQGQITDNVKVIAPQAPVVPHAPVLNASSGTACGGTIDLTWNAVSGATSYKIFRNGTLIKTQGSTNFTDTGLTTGGSYSYTVTAHSDAGDSAQSNTAVSTASGSCGGGGTPTISVTLSANPSTIFTNGTSTLSWTSQNATSCSAAFTLATSTSGMQIVSPATTTAYMITCTNGSQSGSATATVTVVPVNACVVPIIDSTLTASGTVGTAFTYTLVADNASTTSTFSIATSSLPAGLSVHNNVISGTPTTEGTYTVAVSATDSCGTDSKTLTITIAPANNGGGGTPTITVTLTANPDTIAPGATSTLSWTSTNATECSAAWTTSTSTSGSQDVAPGSTTSYSINCANGALTGSATTTVTVTSNNGGGGCDTNCGGGGGGGGCGATCNSTTPGVSSGMGGGGGYTTVPMVLGATTVCDYLHDYLHIGWANDPVEVLKLQLFLKDLEGYTNTPVNGVFDQATFNSVSQFQVQFQPDILTPWGYAQGQSTGYVYILTKKKINEIFCQHAYPLNAQQEAEIAAFRAFMLGLHDHGISINANGSTVATISGVDASMTSSSTDTSGTQSSIASGIASSTATSSVVGSLGDNLAQVASAIFAGPQNFGALILGIVILLAIVLASYAVSRIMIENEKYATLSKEEKRLNTIIFFVGSLIVALVLNFIFGYYVIVLPLLLLIIIMAIVVLAFSVKKTPVVMAPTADDMKAIKTEPIVEIPSASVSSTETATTETPIILGGKVEEKTDTVQK